MDRLVRRSLAAYLPTLLIPIQNLSGLFYFVVPGLFAFQCCFDSCSPFVLGSFLLFSRIFFFRENLWLAGRSLMSGMRFLFFHCLTCPARLGFLFFELWDDAAPSEFSSSTYAVGKEKHTAQWDWKRNRNRFSTPLERLELPLTLLRRPFSRLASIAIDFPATIRQLLGRSH